MRQYRHAIRRYLLEFPAGGLEPGEEPLAAAQRELREEAGLEAARWTSLGHFFSSPGFANEILHVFLAEDLRPAYADPDEDEDLHVVRYGLSGAVRASRAVGGRQEPGRAACSWRRSQGRAAEREPNARARRDHANRSTDRDPRRRVPGRADSGRDQGAHHPGPRGARAAGGGGGVALLRRGLRGGGGAHRARRGSAVRPGGADRQGQGASSGRDRSSGAAAHPLHLSAPGPGPGTHRRPGGERRHLPGLRDRGDAPTGVIRCWRP